MTVLERPREDQRTGAAEPPEAIFPEARRRERRRRALTVLTALFVAGGLSGFTIVVLHVAGVMARAAHPLVTPGARYQSARAAGVVAWGDYAGVLHLGNVATRRQLQIATYPVSESSSGVPVAVDHGRLLWVDVKDRIRSVEIATGRASTIAQGTGVMTSPGGSRLYVDQGTADFLVLDARTLQVIRRVPIPAGWTANPWVARTFAGGLVLTHTGRAAVLGYWRPGSRVQPLGASIGLASVYTPPSGRYSLVAWEPRCTKHASFDSHCPIDITNTTTRRTVTIPSPTRYGFTGGAFSPDGAQFATFVNTDNPSDSFSTPRSELAIINTSTGALRLDPKVNLITTEDAAWAVWLPTGRQLLTGAITATYLVKARTLATRPFYFDGPATRVESVMSSADLNFSTIVVPRTALSRKQQRSLDLTGRAFR